MREDILLAIAQFEDLYNEWDEFKLKLVSDSSVSVYDRNTDEKYSTSESKELITDFKGVLKKNGLMISSRDNETFNIEPYTYEFEAEYESLADDIERMFSAKLTNLKILKRNNNPLVKFSYCTNLTSGEKSKIKKMIDEMVKKYRKTEEVENGSR